MNEEKHFATKSVELVEYDSAIILLKKQYGIFEAITGERLIGKYQIGEEKSLYLLGSISKGALVTAIKSEQISKSNANSKVFSLIREVETNPYLKEQHRIITIDKSINYFVSKLENELKVSIDLDDFDKNTLDLVSNKVNKLKNNGDIDSIYFPLVILFGEMTRRRVKGDWKIEAINYLNKNAIYFQPIIVGGKDKIKYYPWRKIEKYLFEQTAFDLGLMLQIETSNKVMARK
jgi:hypothetical protein